MLISVGESVILVEVAGAGDYANCSTILDNETTKVLAKGWDFNTEVITLTPETDGTLTVPDGTLFIDPVDPLHDCVQRAGKLYDKSNSTDTFTDPVDCTVIKAFAFEDCPYNVQREIVGAACQKYQRGYVGSETLDKYVTEERGEARADARDAESDSDDYNILDNPDLAYLRRNRYPGGIW